MAKPGNISPITTRLTSRWEKPHTLSYCPDYFGQDSEKAPMCLSGGILAIADLGVNEEGRPRFA